MLYCKAEILAEKTLGGLNIWQALNLMKWMLLLGKFSHLKWMAENLFDPYLEKYKCLSILVPCKTSAAYFLWVDHYPVKSLAPYILKFKSPTIFLLMPYIILDMGSLFLTRWLTDLDCYLTSTLINKIRACTKNLLISLFTVMNIQL